MKTKEEVLKAIELLRFATQMEMALARKDSVVMAMCVQASEQALRWASGAENDGGKFEALLKYAEEAMAEIKAIQKAGMN